MRCLGCGTWAGNLAGPSSATLCDHLCDPLAGSWTAKWFLRDPICGPVSGHWIETKCIFSSLNVTLDPTADHEQSIVRSTFWNWILKWSESDPLFGSTFSKLDRKTDRFEVAFSSLHMRCLSFFGKCGRHIQRFSLVFNMFVDTYKI